MQLGRFWKQHSLLTWGTVLFAIALSCLFVQGITDYFSYPMGSDRELARRIFTGVWWMATRALFPDQGYMIWGIALVFVAAISVISLAISALVMWRVPGNAANRQLAGILIALSSLCAIQYFIPFIPEYKSIYESWDSLLARVSMDILIYLLLAVPRFLALFPRVVDSDSVYQQYMRRPLFMRWARKTVAEKSFLPFWHKQLVTGSILWIAVVYPLVDFIVFEGINQFIRFDEWGGLVIGPMLGLGIAYLIWGLPYAFASVTHVYYYGTTEERRRVAWLRAVFFATAFIVAITVAINAAYFLLPHEEAVKVISQKPLLIKVAWSAKVVITTWVFWTLIPVITIGAVGYSVLFGGRLDARLAFTRITLWSLILFPAVDNG
jgi:hypothetical protein